MKVLDVKAAVGMICSTADAIVGNKAFLTEVDSRIGDGDHGIGMALGMQKAKNRVSDMTERANVYEVFAEAGKAMLMSMGGASGVIFGSMFQAGARNMPPREVLTPEEFARMMERSLKAIMERGGARVGDKTMVDALAPAVEAMLARTWEDYGAMLGAAEQAAREGMENTKNYVAKYGRAKSLMERAIGYQDAGATSVWLIFRAMHAYAEANG